MANDKRRRVNMRRRANGARADYIKMLHWMHGTRCATMTELFNGDKLVNGICDFL